MWKQRIFLILWVFSGLGVVLLFVLGSREKSIKKCEAIQITFTGNDKNEFVDENDVRNILNHNGNLIGTELKNIELIKLESRLKSNPWIYNAEIFINNKNALEVYITQRQPVARVFTTMGNSFYVDSETVKLPISQRVTARVPLFTNFPSTKAVLSGPDSILLEKVVGLGKFIINDSFWMAQIAQVNIEPGSTFELYPTIGDQVIELGDGNDLKSKFDKLFSFYRYMWLQNGLNEYKKINVSFNNQIVAVKNSALLPQNDSLNTAVPVSQKIGGNKKQLSKQTIPLKKNIQKKADATSNKIALKKRV